MCLFFVEYLPWKWATKAKTCRRLTTCLCIIVSNYSAAVGMCVVTYRTTWNMDNLKFAEKQIENIFCWKIRGPRMWSQIYGECLLVLQKWPCICSTMNTGDLSRPEALCLCLRICSIIFLRWQQVTKFATDNWDCCCMLMRVIVNVMLGSIFNCFSCTDMQLAMCVSTHSLNSFSSLWSDSLTGCEMWQCWPSAQHIILCFLSNSQRISQ